MILPWGTVTAQGAGELASPFTPPTVVSTPQMSANSYMTQNNMGGGTSVPLAPQMPPAYVPPYQAGITPIVVPPAFAAPAGLQKKRSSRALMLFRLGRNHPMQQPLTMLQLPDNTLANSILNASGSVQGVP